MDTLIDNNMSNSPDNNSPDYYRGLYKKYQANQEKTKEQIIKHISMLSSTVSQLEDNITKLNSMNNDVTIDPAILETFKDITFSKVSNKEIDFANIDKILNDMSLKVEEGLKVEDIIKQELGLAPKPSNPPNSSPNIDLNIENMNLDLNDSSNSNCDNFKIKY